MHKHFKLQVQQYEPRVVNWSYIRAARVAFRLVPGARRSLLAVTVIDQLASQGCTVGQVRLACAASPH
jgi:hypothetical protein